MSKLNGQKVACDRCRGQKLRCIWDPSEPQCQRCQRANAVCTIPVARPMGRPPRQHPSNSSVGSVTSSHRQNDAEYSWDDRNPSSVISDADDTIMTMNPAHASSSSDLMDIFQWLPESDDLNLFAPLGSPALTTSSTLPTLSAPASAPNEPADMIVPVTIASCEGQGMTVGPVDELLGQERLPCREDFDAQLLRSLCEFNVSLSRHPLHRDKDKGSPFPISARGDINQPEKNYSSTNPRNPSPAQPVSNLGLGSLLEITCGLREVVTNFRARSDEAHSRSGGLDRSTALMALSCYTRLDVLYSRVLEALKLMRSGGIQPDQILSMMPELIIDGFSMSRWHDLQLSFFIYMCEQTQDRIRTCIQSGDKALVRQ